MPLENAQNVPNQKSGHLDKNSIWTSNMSGTTTCGGLKELRPSTTHARGWLYHRVSLRPQLDFHSTECLLPLWLPGLRPTPAYPTEDATSDWNFVPDTHSALCCSVSSLSLCVTCVWLFGLTGDLSPNKPDMWKDRNVCE